MKSIYCLITILCLCLGLEGKAKNNETDSLLGVLKTGKPDTVRAKTLNILSDEFRKKRDFDQAMTYAKEALAVSEVLIVEGKKGYGKGLGNAYQNIGLIYKEQQNFPLALENYRKSLVHMEEIGFKKGIAASYINIGLIYFFQGNHPEALKNFLKAKTIREEMGDHKGLGSAFGNIGEVYRMQGNFEEALKNIDSCQRIMKEIGNRGGDATAYSNRGIIYKDQGDIANSKGDKKGFEEKYALSLKNHFEALKIRQEINDLPGIGVSYNNLGNVFMYKAADAEKTGDKAKAKELYKEAFEKYVICLKISQKLEHMPGMAGAYVNLGEISMLQGKNKDAQRYLDSGLVFSKQLGRWDYLNVAYDCLSQLDSAKGDFKKAYEHHKLYMMFRDSLVNEENSKKTVQFQMQYEFDKKEAEQQAEQDKKDIIAKEESQKQRLIMWFATIGLLVVAVFAIIVWKGYQQKKKANIAITSQKEIIEEKQKEILDSIRYAKRIQRSLLPTEKYITKCLNNLMRK